MSTRREDWEKALASKQNELKAFWVRIDHNGIVTAGFKEAGVLADGKLDEAVAELRKAPGLVLRVTAATVVAGAPLPTDVVHKYLAGGGSEWRAAKLLLPAEAEAPPETEFGPLNMAVDKEIPLHGEIMKWMGKRNWAYMHADPHRASRITPGCCDFIIGGSWNGQPKTWWVEVKDRDGKLSDDQELFKSKLAAQGIKMEIVRSMADFLQVVVPPCVPDVKPWVKHPWDQDAPMCVRCAISLHLHMGCEWDDDPNFNLCHECARKLLKERFE